MAHNISGIVIPGDVDSELAASFNAKLVSLQSGFTAIALRDDYIDLWADRLDMHDTEASMPLCDSRVVRHIASTLAGDRPFALIETDYFGGVGTQWAAAYRDNEELVPFAKADAGPINAALKAIGVRSGLLSDAFTIVGLQNHRNWDSLFDEDFG